MHLERQVAQREKQTITIYYIHACLFKYTSYSILLETSPKKSCMYVSPRIHFSVSVCQGPARCVEKDVCES
jgi:hypothetical protein